MLASVQIGWLCLPTLLHLRAFILFQSGRLIKSPCDLLILWAAEGNDSSSSSSSVKPSGVAPAPPPHSKWAQSWAPKPPHKAMKEVGSLPQSSSDISYISVPSASLYVHQIRYLRASLTATLLLLPSHFIFLSNITALWWSAASVTIS